MEVYFQVMALFLLMLAGYLAGKFRWLTREGFTGLSRFVYCFALPALTFVKLQVQADAALLSALLYAFLLACVAMLLCAGVSFLIFRRESAPRRALFINLSTFSNCGFLGYPVIEICLGSDALIYAVMFATAFNLLSWTLGIAFFGGRKAISMKRLAINPALLAVILGVTALVCQIRLPAPVNHTLTLLGSTTTPLSLVVIGAQLVGVKPSILRDRSLIFTCLLRLAVFPLLLLGALRLLQTPVMMTAALFLCYAMPSAALTAMQADQYQCEAPLASVSVAVITALSAATIPLMMMWVV